MFSSKLSDITPVIRNERIIDITNTPLVPATRLREKLNRLQAMGELDGGLPIVKDEILVGLIPAPDLEYALDSLKEDDGTLCLMAPRDEDWDDEMVKDPTDFTPYIDPAPIALERHSPMDLVYEMFAKLGLRYMCVLQDGKFAGVVSSSWPFIPGITTIG